MRRKNISNAAANVIFVLLISLLFANGGVFAQRTITLDEAIKIALKNNSDLKQSKLDIQKAQATINEVFGNALPTLDLSAQFAHTLKDQKIPFPDLGAIFQNAAYGVLFDENLLDRDDSKYVPMGTSLMSMSETNNFQAQLQLTQILFNSAVFTGIGVSKDYLEVAKAQYNMKLVDVIMNIKNAFYSVLYTREMLDILNVSYTNAQENLTNVEHLAAQGLASEFATLDASVRVENIKPSIKQLENAVASATDGLKILLAIPQNEEIVVSGSIDYVDEDLQDQNRLVRSAQNNNLSLKTLEKALEVSKASVDASAAGYYPSLAGFINYGYSAMSNTLSNFTTFPTSTAGISFSMNLFKGLQTKYQVQEAKIDVYKAEEQIAQLKDAIEMQVRTNINELQRIKEVIAAQERNISVAERAYILATTRFKEGTGSQLEIMNSDLALKQAKTNKLESVYNYIVSKAKLDNLMGTLNTEWLLND